ncbi:PREDICTED: transcription factor Adf-1-like [Rhagoletis zephyria]|uniref:transcription factor Adf-1-like n=1 Tax=Rhagoletis zephyria TaxID=28612 RepID=UPI0008114BA8|nr:PREDICTED: transcription factor Adf-1-like [Rhagoletis zephyria]
MFEYELINAIRQYPCLYDKNSKTTEKSQEIIRRCWKDVARETGEPLERCQNRWRSLRDRFVKETRHFEEGKRATCWQYMAEMEFLRDFLEPRKRYASDPAKKTRTVSKAQKEEPQENIYSDRNGSEEEEAYSSSHKRSYDDDIDYQLAEEDTTDGPMGPKIPFIEAFLESPINEPLISQSYQKATSSRMAIQNAQTKFDKLVGTLNEYIKGRIKEREETNDDDFFGLLKKYLAKIPENEQDKLKADILIMVFNKARES